MTPWQLKQQIDAFYGMAELAVAVTPLPDDAFKVEIWKGSGTTNVSVMLEVDLKCIQEPDFERKYVSEAVETLLNDGVSFDEAFDGALREAYGTVTDVESRPIEPAVMQ